MSTYTKKIVSSGAVQIASGSGAIDLSANSYVSANELRPSTALAVAYGGSGATTASNARTNLGLAIGSDVQAYSAKLSDIAGLAPSNNDYIKWDGSNFVSSSIPSGVNYNADEVTLTETGGDTFSIKNGGVGTTQLASTSVTASKLGIDVAGSGLSGGNGSALAIDNAVVVVASGAVDQLLTGVKTFSAQPVLQAGQKDQESGQSGYSIKKQYELQSTDDTQFSLATIAIPTDSSMHIEAEIALCSDDVLNVASFKVYGLVKNVAGTCSSLQLNDEIVYKSDAGFACVLDVNTTNARIRCTGKANTNLRWVANVRYIVSPKYA
jgi:hypothetical protein